MAKILVVLSGCGVFDGSEIHESVITLLALDRTGAQVMIAAPDVELKEINHNDNSDTASKRNVLIESARIARGPVTDIKEINSADFDAIIFPGGYGAAKNLCDFAFKGPQGEANSDIAKVIQEFHSAGKVIGALCIAPALIALVLGKEFQPTLTIGTDLDTAAGINATGAKHQNCSVDEICIDEKNKIVSTPAYMLATSIKEAASGIEKLVTQVLKMI